MPGTLGRFEDRLDRRLRRLEIRCEAPLVADTCRESSLVQHRLQVVEDLRADAKGVAKAVGAGRDEHELLQVDPVLRVRATVDHVHQRYRQDMSLRAAEPAIERHARIRGGSLRDRERAAEDRVGTESALRRRPVELDQDAVDLALLVRLDADECPGDLAVDVRDGVEDALAEIEVAVAVAELDRLVLAGRCA